MEPQNIPNSSIPTIPPATPLPAKNLNKKILIILGVIVIIILVGFIIKLFLLPKQPGKSLKQKVSIADNEWKNIKNKISQGYVYQYFNQQIKQPPKTFSQKKTSKTEEFFVSTHKYANIPSGELNNRILGESTDSALPQQELDTSLVKIRLNGAINNKEKNKVDEYEILLTNVSGRDKEQNKGVSDILINGKIGDLQLGDPDFDALHLSVIEPNQSSAYVKAEINDIFLIVLDRIMHGPDPEATISGVISAEYEDVYPYFDRYVEINKESDTKKDLPKELSDYIDEYIALSQQTFQSTLGNLDNYLTKGDSYVDTIAGESVIKVETKVNPSSFFDQLKIFLSKMDNFAKDNKGKYEQYCQNDELKAEQDCLRDFGLPLEDNTDYAYLLGLATLVNFDKFEIILSNNKNFLGIDLGISLNQTVFNLLKKTFPDQIDGLGNIANLNFELTFRSMSPKTITLFETPSSYIRFLPDGSTASVDKNIKNNTEKLAEDLFFINRGYINELWQKDFEKLAQNRVQYCQDKWKPNFCLEAGSDWKKDEYASPSSFKVSYPSQFIGRDAKYLNIYFNNDQTLIGGFLCDKTYDKYSEIQTPDGLVFRINLLPKDEFTDKSGLLSLVTCYKNSGGKFTTSNPLTKTIEVTAYKMTFEEISQRAGEILKTIQLQNKDELDLTSEFSKGAEKYETLYYGNATKDERKACNVGFYRAAGGVDLMYDNMKKDLLINREFNNIVIPENTKYCRWGDIPDSKDCIKCTNGNLVWTELSDCKGLSCNP